MDTIRQIIEFFAPKMAEKTADIITYCVFAGVWAAVTVLAELGIDKMAKNKGLDRLWRAYIPFYNLVVLGEIVGGASVLRKRIKPIGVVCAVLQALFVFDLVFTEITYVYNDVFEFYVLKQQALGDSVMTYLAPHGVGVAYQIFSTLLSLATLVFSFALYLEVFRSYCPSGAMAICILTVFFSPVAPIALFVVRNRKYVNFQEYMQQRMAAFYSAAQQRPVPPQNPFGEYPDGNDPFGAARPAAPKANEDPFEEFSDAPDAPKEKDDQTDLFD